MRSIPLNIRHNRLEGNQEFGGYYDKERSIILTSEALEGQIDSKSYPTEV